uniref:Piwi domain-containing protein n=1 Tax=Oryza punctata TaxID=4537 RepID=A0A0E0LKF1_ORYPU
MASRGGYGRGGGGRDGPYTGGCGGGYGRGGGGGQPYYGGGGGGGGQGRGYYDDGRGYQRGMEGGGGGGRGGGGGGYQGDGERGYGRGRRGGGGGGGGYRGDGEGSSYGRGRGGGGGGGYHADGEAGYGRGRGGGRDYDGGRGGGGRRGGRGGGSSYHQLPPPDLPQAPERRLAAQYARGMDIAALRAQFKGLTTRDAASPFPARPGFGTAGEECVVKANHFFVGLKNDNFHHYDVAIAPDPVLKGLFRTIVSKLVTERRHTDFGGRLPAYDGRANLYTAGELPFKSRELEVELSGNRKFKVAIRHVAPVSLQDLWMVMAGCPAGIPSQALQLLDIVLRDMVLAERNNMGYVAFGRSYFSAGLGSRELDKGIFAWKGFYQSCRVTQQGLSLNIDMSSTAFIEPGRVLNFVEKAIGHRITNAVTVGYFLNNYGNELMRTLKGVKIEVTHRGNLLKKYRIASFTEESADVQTFKSPDGIKTVKEYFNKKYKLKLAFGNLPCLQVGSKEKPNYLPMELCNIIPGQRYKNRLSPTQVSNLMNITNDRPCDRESSIRQTVRSNQYNSTERADEFGIEIDSYPTTLKARVLKAPMLKYHDSGKVTVCKPEDGAWNMKDRKVVNGATIKSWACVNLCHDLDNHVVEAFCLQLVRTSERTGLDFANVSLPILNARPHHIKADLPMCYQEACSRSRDKRIDLLLVVMTDDKNNASLYGDVKRICETEIGVLSQCCRAKQVYKERNVQYCANVALKINAKAGGRNSVFLNVEASLPVVSKSPTIIFGADVTHPGSFDESTPSIASVVASADWPEVTKYNSVVRMQASRKEIIQDLEGIVKELLNAFKRDSKMEPKQLIFYRDGVSEGQFQQVVESEIPEIEKAWKSLYAGKPRITFIVVQKRHHTRLFPNNYHDPRGMEGTGNVRPGTVVDTVICHPRELDFFLISHAGIKGTSRPSHYHALRDDNNFTADQLQSLTNNLCYIYTSCTRSVSIPPPVYYAHKLAFRARFYLTQAPVAGGDPGAVRFQWVLPEIKEEVKNSMFFC